MSRFALLVVVATSMLGCGAAYPSQIVVGPYPAGSPTELWQRTLAAVRAAEYQPEVADPNRGHIVVPSRIYGSREHFVIQLYREGWIHVQLDMQGGGFWRRRIPADLGEEQLLLTLALRGQLEGTAGERAAVPEREQAPEGTAAQGPES